MNYSKVSITCGIYLLVLCAVGHLVARDAAADELAERLPRNCCLVIRSSNVAATCRAFQDTTFGAAVSGKEFTPLVTELRKRDQAGPLHLQPWTGFDWPGLAKIEAPAVMAAFPLQDGSAGMVWLFADDVNKAAISKSVRDYFTAKKWRAVAKDQAGGTIVTYGPPAAVKEPARVWFESAGMYGIASTPRAAQTLLATKPEASFAVQPASKSLVVNDAPSDVQFFVQPLLLWKALKAPAPGKSLRMTEPVLAAERLGLGGIKEVTGNVHFTPDAKDQWQITANAIVPEPYPQALKALDMLPGPAMALPDWVDTDTARVAAWRWNFVSGMQAFGHLVDEVTDPGPKGQGLFEQVLDGIRDDVDGPRIDIRKELFPKLGPEVIAVSRGDQTLTSVSILPKHLPDVTDFFERFFKDDDEIAHETIGEVQLWSGKDGAPVFAGAGEPTKASIRAVAIGPQGLLLATDTKALKEAIAVATKKKAAEPLTDTADWGRHAAWRTKNETDFTAYETFTRPSVAWGEPYESARTAKKGKADYSPTTKVWLFFLFGTTSRRADLPQRAVPEFSAWGDSLPPVSFILSKTKEGWSANSASLPANPE